MHYVYVLQSLKNGKKYVGYTSRSVEQRLNEHNSGSNSFTRSNRPFEIIYFEKHDDEAFAKKRERYLKSGHGRSYLKEKLIKDNMSL